MKCRLACGDAWWCILDLPARVVVRCTAKMFVLMFSTMMLALAIPTIITGAVADNPIVGRIIPSSAASILIATGVMMLLTALGGYAAAACALKRRRCSRYLLCLLMLFTLIALLLSLIGAVYAFAYAKVVEIAEQSGFGDIESKYQWVVDAVYKNIRTAFFDAMGDCVPQAYNTSTIARGCQDWQPDAECVYMETGWLGLFCGYRAGPFDIDATLAFPRESVIAQAQLKFDSQSDFVWWVNQACMPRVEDVLAIVNEENVRARVAL